MKTVKLVVLLASLALALATVAVASECEQTGRPASTQRTGSSTPFGAAEGSTTRRSIAATTSSAAKPCGSRSPHTTARLN